LNTFGIPEWEPDVRESIEDDCVSWCTALLYFVPAKVAGVWKTSRGDLLLEQTYQVVSGTLAAEGRQVPVKGALRGTDLTLEIDGQTLRATVNGDSMAGDDWSG